MTTRRGNEPQLIRRGLDAVLPASALEVGEDDPWRSLVGSEDVSVAPGEIDEVVYGCANHHERGICANRSNVR